jgi:hypothetical protein
MPGFAGAKNKSLLQPYMVANVSRWFLAAEKVKDTNCPGSITGGVPVPLKVPDSTKGLLSNTFSMVMVLDWVTTSSFFLQDASNATADNIINVFSLFRFIFLVF